MGLSGHNPIIRGVSGTSPLTVLPSTNQPPCPPAQTRIRALYILYHTSTPKSSLITGVEVETGIMFTISGLGC